MRLDSKLVIGGEPAIKVRNFIRRVSDSPPWDINIPMKLLRLDAAEATALIGALEKEKLIKLAHRQRAEWIVTQKRHSLAAAKASLPITRKTLEVALQWFMERVREVNRDSSFLAKVTAVGAFGSILRSDIERFGDIDLAVRLEPKEADLKILRQLNEQRVEEYEKSGRRIGDIVRRSFWWRIETLRFLKGRSRAVSLHEYDNDAQLIEAGPHRWLLGDKMAKKIADKTHWRKKDLAQDRAGWLPVLEELTSQKPTYRD